MVEVSLHPDAEAEYEHALGWYMDRSVRAAAGFETAVDRAIDFISRFPEANPLCDDRHRYCSLRRYPYGLIYRFDGQIAHVIAVAHDRQLPGFWIGRE